MQKGIKILVVDNSELVRTTYQFILDDGSILLAKDGVEAVHYLRNNKDITMLISEYEIPRLSCLELHRYVKSFYPHITFVLSSSEYNLIPESHKLGMDGFLKKPFTEEELQNLVETHIKREKPQ
ncbi:MAG: response regulator [Candidatus Margulisbacteria bacterium]|nr:response regulator [Candidatus Margulisiibacteriota bacterium]